MPIQEYKAMQRTKARNERIAKAMAESQQVAIADSQTQSIISSGITYDGASQHTLGSVAVPGVVQQSSAYDALTKGPQYARVPGKAQISQESYNTLREAESNSVGFDMPMKNYPRSMSLSQIRNTPNAYGTDNPDPRYAKIPVLPTDPAMIHDDDNPREYFADEYTASQVAAETEDQYQMDPLRGREPSLAGNVPMQYAAKVKDLRAPTTKNMVLQTQNDGQRKMVPIIKANPWGLQLKNRMNFSENNILEADLKGNVASRDQIGGNILNAPNMFANDTSTNYGQIKQVSAPVHASGWTSGRMTDQSVNKRYGQSSSNISWLSRKGEARPEVTGLGPQQEIQMQNEQEYQMTPEQQVAYQRQQMAREMQTQQESEEAQPSFYDKLKSGTLRQPKTISRSIPVKKPSIMDRIKGTIRSQPIPVPESDEVSVDMTEEEFNALSTEDQQRIIEQSQQRQESEQQSMTSADEMANYQAAMREQEAEEEAYRQDLQLQKEAASINQQLAEGRARQWEEDHEFTNVRPTKGGFSPGGSSGGTKYT